GVAADACIGISAIFDTIGALMVDEPCSGASASLATMGEAAGSEAASGVLTTRRLTRDVALVEGATAADSAEGDSGVTPLDCRLMVGTEMVGVFSGCFSLRILSTVLSVTGFSFIDLSKIGVLGCSVTLGCS